VIDLHCHILPGVDDGPDALATAVDMCRLAVAEGCEAIIATPHQRRDEWPSPAPATVAELVARLQSEVGPRPRLFAGAEVRVDSDLLADLEQPDRNGVVPLAGSSFLLLEFDPWGLGPDPVELVQELSQLGLRAVVAHPEVTPALAENPDLVERMVEAGALLQLTAASVAGIWGRRPRELAWAWIGEGMAHFVGSDAHDLDRRPPGLRRAAQEIARRFSAEAAQRLTADNPRALLEGRDLAAAAGSRGV